jgi:translation initiation factor 1
MKKHKESHGGGLVYSTEKGRMCPACAMPKNQCVCSQREIIAAGDGIVRVGRATRGRKGKGVTVISGIPLPEADLKELGQKLKKLCGAGGTLQDGIIEIQGDHRDQVIRELLSHGWTVRRSGG